MLSNYPVVILAGGKGTRILEETSSKPKPMVTIGGKPIIWHIINFFAQSGCHDFYIATGYMNELIDEWVGANNKNAEWGFNCKVECVYTGEETQTGGRIKKVLEKINAPTLFMTYGDGLANVDLQKLLNLHNNLGKKATVTSVRPPARFGKITSVNGLVTQFGEKSQVNEGWINGGFFVLDKDVQNYIYSDGEAFEYEPMQRLVVEKELTTYEHSGFWQPMDTLREKLLLEELYLRETPPWLLR